MRSISYPLSPPAAGEKFFNCLIVYFSANARKKWSFGRFFFLNGPAVGLSAARDRREIATRTPSSCQGEVVKKLNAGIQIMPNPIRPRTQPTVPHAHSVACPKRENPEWAPCNASRRTPARCHFALRALILFVRFRSSRASPKIQAAEVRGCPIQAGESARGVPAPKPLSRPRS